MVNVGLAGGTNAGLTNADTPILKHPVEGSCCLMEYVAFAGKFAKRPVVLLNEPPFII